MDISLVSKNCVKLKGKKIAFIIDPEVSMPKTSADAILLTGLGFDKSRVSESRVVIKGMGEYEVGGSKISGVGTTKGTIYKLLIDNVNIVVGRTLDFSKLEGKFATCDIALINAQEEFNESSIASLGPKVAVIFGDKKTDVAKKLGANNIALVAKFSITKDKLPEEIQVVVLA